MNKTSFPVKQMIKEMFNSGFQPKTIPECLMAISVELLLITVAVFTGYSFAYFSGTTSSAYPVLTILIMLGVSRTMRYSFLLWKYKKSVSSN